MENIQARSFVDFYKLITSTVSGTDDDYNGYAEWDTTYSKLKKMLELNVSDGNISEENLSGVVAFTEKFMPPYLKEDLKDYVLIEVLSDNEVFSRFVNDFNSSYLNYDVEVNETNLSRDGQSFITRYKLTAKEKRQEEHGLFYRNIILPNISRYRSGLYIENLCRERLFSLSNSHYLFENREAVRFSTVENLDNPYLKIDNLFNLSDAVVLEMYLEAAKLIDGYEDLVIGEQLTEEELEIENAPYVYPIKDRITQVAEEMLIEKYPHLKDILDLRNDTNTIQLEGRLPF